jgi:hypothetical protein
MDFFRGMFDANIGVYLPEHLKNQKRIKDGSNECIITDNENKKKFTFFPNRLVTL